MSVEFLFPVLTLSHTASDAKKVFTYFEEMLELDIPRQGWAYSAVRRRRCRGVGCVDALKSPFAVVVIAKYLDGQNSGSLPLVGSFHLRAVRV